MKYSAVILAGGLGERMRPLTDTVPKPMLPVGGEPNLCLLLQQLLKSGFDSAIVTLRYLPEKIRALGNSCCGVDLCYVTEDEPLGTAGAVKAVAHLLKDDFLVISGDAVCGLDLSAALAEHKRRFAAATVVLHTVTQPCEYGCVACDGTGAVVSFCEKPAWQSVRSDKVNTGIYFLGRRALGYIGDGACDFSADVFPAMLAAGEPVIGYEAEGYWRDIGSFSEYLAANRELSAIKHGVTEGSVCGDGFTMGENSAFINSVAFDGVRIADNCSVTGSILARNVVVGDGCVLRDGCVIGEGAVINDGVRLGAGTVIGTGKTVTKNRGDKMTNCGIGFENGRMSVPFSEAQTRLCRLAGAAAAGAEGIVGVCCDVRGKRKNEAELFARACRDRGGTVFEFGPVIESAAGLAGAFYGCALTFYLSPDGDGTCVRMFDVSGDVPSVAREKKLLAASLKEQNGRTDGKLVTVSGLTLLYCNALSVSQDLHGVTAVLIGCEGDGDVCDALKRAGAGIIPAEEAKDGDFIINCSEGAALLSSGCASCTFDECLLIVLGLISPSECPVVSLPYFLPKIYAAAAEARGIRVLRYQSRPSLDRGADAENRRARLACPFTTDPLFCAVKLAGLLRKQRLTLAEAAEKYVTSVISRKSIKVPEKRKAACMRRLYESYMPYQTDACDGVRVVERGAEGVIMADDSDAVKLVISADSEEAAEDAVTEVMMRLGL
ncbi:MAG: NTP transferase domain-containing protein [Clostridia bacterium]|nr:NTP transferase domain-containing protein [Clostridia bacterium]